MLKSGSRRCFRPVRPRYSHQGGSYPASDHRSHRRGCRRHTWCPSVDLASLPTSRLPLAAVKEDRAASISAWRRSEAGLAVTLCGQGRSHTNFRRRHRRLLPFRCGHFRAHGRCLHLECLRPSEGSRSSPETIHKMRVMVEMNGRLAELGTFRMTPISSTSSSQNVRPYLTHRFPWLQGMDGSFGIETGVAGVIPGFVALSRAVRALRLKRSEWRTADPTNIGATSVQMRRGYLSARRK